MKKTGLLISFTIISITIGLAQPEKIPIAIQKNDIETHVRFLASDELRGRDTGSPELEIAARYIAEVFRSSGLKPAAGAAGFFQPVSLVSEKPPASASFFVMDEKLEIGKDLLVLSGDSVLIEAPIVYANYAQPEDLEALDVKGKIVVAKAGTPGITNPQSYFFSSKDKVAHVAAKGGLALVELYHSSQMPWSLLVRYLNTEQLVLSEAAEGKAKLPLIWVNNDKGKWLAILKDQDGENATLQIAEKERKTIPAKNVVAMVEGTSRKLKNEFVILSAHYDHVGVGSSSDSQDTIYNGARDNAVGTAALLEAARYFGKNPPKRSVLFLAVTAEEKGMLGSRWYADHPLIPLDQMVFNLNTDGAGYNDTTKVTVIGLERTTAEPSLLAASQEAGLAIIPDPEPEQNLYDRSDNASFAAKGIPAVDFAPGFTAFDQDIMKYYHQAADEAETLNFDYIERFVEAYIMAAQKVANMPNRPFWKPGDKYEREGKELYGQ